MGSLGSGVGDTVTMPASRAGGEQSCAQTVKVKAEHARQSRVDLSGVRVRVAATNADFEIVADLRRTGFSRVIPDSTNICWIDELDSAPGVFSLIGFSEHGEPVATMRVQDGRTGPLELERFVPLVELVTPDDLPATQFGRLSVIKAPGSPIVMYGLFKAAWRWGFRENIRSIVITTPPWSKPIYDAMFFAALGPRGEFLHQYAGGAPHVTMTLPVFGAEKIWRVGGSPLCQQIFDTDHPHLEIQP